MSYNKYPPSGGGSGTGNVVGPGSSTDNAVARFSGITGQLLKNSTVIVDNVGNTTGFGTISSGELTSSSLTASTVLVAGGSKKIQSSAVTTTTLGFLDATSSIQTQLNARVVGPGSATNNAITRFDTTTGVLVKNSVVTIADATGNIAGAGTVSSAEITSSSLTASTVLVAGAGKQIQSSAVTSTTLGFLDATSSIQTQLNARVVGPAGATNNALVRFDLATGLLVKNSVVTVADSTGNIAGAGTISSGEVTSSSLTASTVLVAGASKQIQSSGVTSTTLAFLDATSSIQTQLNGCVLLAGRTGGQTIIGGTGTTDTLVLQTTSGAGAAGADIIFKGGNNGATEFARILNAGNFAIGTSSPNAANTLEVNGHARITLSAGIGGNSVSGSWLFVTGTGLGTGTTSAGVNCNATFGSTTTSTGISFYSNVATQATSFTVTDLAGFYANNAVKGAGSTITNQYGLYVLNLTSGTNNFGVYTAGTTPSAFGGKVGIGLLSAPGAQLEIDSSAAGTIGAIVKGAASRTAQVLQLQTSAGGNLGTVGGSIFVHFADASTTSTNGTFDALYTDTTVANTFAVNGDSVTATYILSVVSSATATREFKILFGGITVFDSGANIYAATGTIKIFLEIIRVTSTTARASVQFDASGSSTIAGYSSITYVSAATLTGITFSGTNDLVIQAAAASTGAASGDITARTAMVQTRPTP